MSDEIAVFQLRQAARTYISKVFTWGAHTTERLRNVRMVMEGSDILHLGEVEGALCIRLSGEKRKTQVTAVVTQDDKAVRRLTLQSFQSRKGEWYQGFEESSFTFRDDEFQRLLTFLDRIAFVDLSNENRFDIEYISSGAGRKVIIDATDRSIVERIRRMSGDQRAVLLRALQESISTEEINILLGRRQALEKFEREFESEIWSEREWQDFFERESWVFGYGLDYRVMRVFDREMTVSGGGSDNRDRPVVDFLMSFTDPQFFWRSSDLIPRSSVQREILDAPEHVHSVPSSRTPSRKFSSKKRSGWRLRVVVTTTVAMARAGCRHVHAMRRQSLS